MALVSLLPLGPIRDKKQERGTPSLVCAMSCRGWLLPVLPRIPRTPSIPPRSPEMLWAGEKRLLVSSLGAMCAHPQIHCGISGPRGLSWQASVIVEFSPQLCERCSFEAQKGSLYRECKGKFSKEHFRSADILWIPSKTYGLCLVCHPTVCVCVSVLGFAAFPSINVSSAPCVCACTCACACVVDTRAHYPISLPFLPPHPLCHTAATCLLLIPATPS